MCIKLQISVEEATDAPLQITWMQMEMQPWFSTWIPTD